jgi:peptidoglycan/LPS O-acetylase OafA/YrhL
MKHHGCLMERLAFLQDIPFRFRRRMSGGAYKAEIDGLRFVAIAIVVTGHFMERAVRFFPALHSEAGTSVFVDLFLRPGLGVRLFFVISGFIIATQALKSKHSPLSSAFLRTYFGRRILRIEPPYFIILIVTWLVISVTGYMPPGITKYDVVPQSLDLSLAGSVLYLHDLVWGTFPRLFPPGWSLEVEVQFYILAPLLLWMVLRMREGFSKTVLCLGALVLSSFFAALVPDQMGSVHTSYSIFAFFNLFWLGILMTIFAKQVAAAARHLSPLAASLLGWAGLVAFVAIYKDSNSLLVNSAMNLFQLATIAAMFVSAFAAGSSFRAFCIRPWISFIGGACYSIYLVHLQILQILTAALAKLAPSLPVSLIVVYAALEIAAVIAAGLVFYICIERTFMLANWPQVFWRSLTAKVTGPKRLENRVAGKEIP